jgi:NhaP-type Na+/H+ or K+/H+ antiporter
LTALTLTVVAVSIVVHGISVTPVMRVYNARVERRSNRRRGAAM